MKKLCIIARSCMSSNYYRVINACEGKYQIVRHLRDADWCIFPFCSCNDENITRMEEELKQCLRIKKENTKVILTGCIFFVKESKRRFLKKYNIDYLVPMDNQVEEICKILDVEPSKSVYNHYSNVVGEVKIAEGCLNKCSFCRIHYSNRELCSNTMQEIEDQVKDLVSRGVKFVRLTGLNTAQYGIDIYGSKALPFLLQQLSKIDGLEGIEVFDCSLYDLDDDIANAIICNDLILGVYIDIQSGSDKLLRKMNVGYTVEKIKKYISLLKGKIRYTRIISGFPGEDMESVIETTKLLRTLEIYNFVVCEYCNSKDTPSGKMKQLPEEVIQAHTLLYKKVQKIMMANKMLKEEGNIYVGYVNGLAYTFIKVYCPSIGEIRIEGQYNLNLRDKVEVCVKNCGYSLVRIIESTSTKTEFPKESTNKLVDFLSNVKEITTDFTLPVAELSGMISSIFLKYGGNKLSREEFQKNISDLPEVLKEGLMIVYDHK